MRWRAIECVLVEFIKRVGGKAIKCEACRAFYRFFAKSLINYIIQEYECKILLSHDIKITKKSYFGVKTSRFCRLLINVIMDYFFYQITSHASVSDIKPLNNIDKTIVKWFTDFVT